MDQNLQMIAKKIWKIVRVVYLMLRKGISKGKLLAELNVLMKRGKIASKSAILNLITFHHHRHGASTSGHDGSLSFPGDPQDEYDFSCSNSPAAYPTLGLPFHLNKRRHSRAPPPQLDRNAAAEALEIINSAAASPALPGFGPTPVVRQLWITDSPFPLRETEEDSNVDEAAEEFITKFYNDLRRQKF